MRNLDGRQALREICDREKDLEERGICKKNKIILLWLLGSFLQVL